MKTTTNTTPAALAAAARHAAPGADRAAAVMTRAHDMTRRTLEQWPAADYRVTFAAAMRIAWEDANAPSAAAEWATKSPEEQIDALTRMTYKAASRDLAGTDRRGNARADRFAWARTKELALDPANVTPIVNEAYTRLIPYLCDEKHEDKPLNALMYQAVTTAAQAINRAEKRNARPAMYMTEAEYAEENARRAAVKLRKAEAEAAADPNGYAVAAIEARNAATAARDKARRAAIVNETARDLFIIIDDAAPAADRFIAPEAAAIVLDELEALPADDTDRRILSGMLQQYSRRDIADTLGMSHTAVNKRAAKMTARYNARNERNA